MISTKPTECFGIFVCGRKTKARQGGTCDSAERAKSLQYNKIQSSRCLRTTMRPRDARTTPVSTQHLIDNAFATKTYLLLRHNNLSDFPTPDPRRERPLFHTDPFTSTLPYSILFIHDIPLPRRISLVYASLDRNIENINKAMAPMTPRKNTNFRREAVFKSTNKLTTARDTTLALMDLEGFIYTHREDPLLLVDRTRVLCFSNRIELVLRFVVVEDLLL
ncbi:hypothetical protein EVAR_20170_1 [Eumeta japonica]|uniref:Uncharacterized protein n=1 Tax=Eumeta variegata TaxID=151549 RepID=A0A4C1UTP9_EUMVA|nr:hypothetical protein EVAR_20170_1 [Eumeta japonica]